MRPKKISVRPGNGLEGPGIVVWIYHRKVQVQLYFENFPSVDHCILEALTAWKTAMLEVE